MRYRSLRAVGMGGVLAAFAACSSPESGTAPEDEELAVAFDGLSRDANAGGDAEGGAAFSGAAMALRLGIRPTEIAVSVGGESRRYLAFVHVLVRVTNTGRSFEHRTMVAFRGLRRPEEVLYLAATADEQPLLHPASAGPAASPLAAAIASWTDFVNRKIYVATAGKAGIKQESLGDPCPKISSGRSVKCQTGKFAVLLNGEFHQIGRDRSQVAAGTALEIGTRSGGVNGALITF